MQGEKLIENEILSYLSFRDIFAFKVKSQGTYDQKEGRFRRPSKHYRRGTADILGIYKGRPLAIEVKSEKGRLSVHQRMFLDSFIKYGGIALVSRSVEQLEKQLGEVDEGLLAAADVGSTKSS